MNIFKSSFLLLVSFILISHNSEGQYGNEWINKNQTYLKIPIGENGIYKLDYNALSSLGVPLSSVNPKNFQLFRNGKEEKIYVAGENDNNFDPTDFIEFYGRYNDGELDEALFKTPVEQPQKFKSLYTDSVNYYLTWSSSTLGLRFADFSDANYTGKTSDTWIWYQSHVSPQEQFYDGAPFSKLGYWSEFTEGEGWFSTHAYRNLKPVLSVPTPYYNSSGPSPECTFGAYGKSDPKDIINNINHKLEVSINNTLIFEKFFKGYKRVEPGFNEPKISLSSGQIGNNTTNIQFASTYLSKGPIAASFAKIDYPRSLNLGNESYFEWEYTGDNSYFSFTAYGGNSPRIYDITNGVRISGTKVGSDLKFNCSQNGNKKLVIADESTHKTIAAGSVKVVDFSGIIDPLATNYDYLIISHPTLANSAQEYKSYRESAQGGNYNVLLVYSTDLYNQYYFGLHHPMAIRNFCKNFYDNQNTPPTHVLLLGKGQLYSNIRFDTERRLKEDLVPTWGTPPSDYPFVSDYTPGNIAQSIAIGRVPARNDEDVRKYLYKIKLHEAITEPAKKVLFLTGGGDTDEFDLLKSHQEDYYNRIKGIEFGAEGEFIDKENAETIDETLTATIQDKINEGIHTVGYFGHGASQILEIDVGKPETLQNEGKYPLFLFNGCTLGNTFNEISLAEQFLLQEKVGSLSWIASSSFGFVSYLQSWTSGFYENLYNEHYGKTIGEVMKITTEAYQNPAVDHNRAQCRQMTYHGDPALRLYTPLEPDYTLSVNEASRISPDDYNAELDSFAVNINIKSWS